MSTNFCFSSAIDGNLRERVTVEEAEAIPE